VPELLSGPKRDAAGTPADDKRGTRTHVVDLSAAVAGSARLPPIESTTTSVPREQARLPTVEVPGLAAERGADEEPSPETQSPGADSTPAAAVTVAASEPVAPPPSPTSSGSSARTNEAPAVARATVAPKPVASTQGGWAVQVGAFGSAASARKLVGDLKQDGLSAYVAPLNRNGRTLHRVRVGPEATRAEAETLAARIKRKGLPAAVVAAD
jgi:cell division septation protein DedD